MALGERMKWIFVTITLVFLTACDHQEYCNKLKEKANSSDIQVKLKYWVASNITNKKFAIEEVNMGGGMVPGFYYLLNPNFDWAILGFANRPQVRLIGELDKVESVFFGERSRYGILVSASKSINYGLNDDFYSYVHESNSEGIAYICMPRD